MWQRGSHAIGQSGVSTFGGTLAIFCFLYWEMIWNAAFCVIERVINRAKEKGLEMGKEINKNGDWVPQSECWWEGSERWREKWERRNEDEDEDEEKAWWCQDNAFHSWYLLSFFCLIYVLVSFFKNMIRWCNNLFKYIKIEIFIYLRFNIDVRKLIDNLLLLLLLL